MKMYAEPQFPSQKKLSFGSKLNKQDELVARGHNGARDIQTVTKEIPVPGLDLSGANLPLSLNL
jgi:hypothetical protein